MKEVKEYIRDIKDFPKRGIVYRDITPLFLEPEVIDRVIDRFVAELDGQRINKVIGIESRGFFLAPMLAQKLNAGFVPVRKKGKLPYNTLSMSYDLEYGKDELEIHTDAVHPHENILVHDDVLATGGTAEAVIKLVEEMYAHIVASHFLIELKTLKGAKKISRYPYYSMVEYS
jgi:adenine phosphoribosyltransferase